MNGSSDETQNLLDKNGQPDPLRSTYLATNGGGPAGSHTNDAFIPIDDVDKSTTPSTTAFIYGSLEHIQSLKPLMTPQNKSLPKKVRNYYEVQLKLITAVEDALLPKSDETKDHATEYEKQLKRRADRLSMATLITNAVLVIVKVAIAIVSNSLSIISSLVDSAVDLLVSLILLWTGRKIKNRDIYKYPEGRTRLEPIAIVILSVIMCSVSVLIIFKSAETLDDDLEYFIHLSNGTSTYSLPTVRVGTITIIVMVGAIVSKAILFIMCYQIKSPTMIALTEANLNDVASNAVALVCGLVASEALQGNIDEEAVVVDPIGAILISVYIMIAWVFHANRQIRRLSGMSAEPYFLQQLTHIVYNYRPDMVKKISWVQAVHHGTHFFVEAHICLPGWMRLSEAHEIGAHLQKELEVINDVDRAFVHLDFVSSHELDCEHKHI